MKFIQVVKAVSPELKDSDRKEIIIYLIDTMDRQAPLFAIKKYIDATVEYEKKL
jgi:hypothetical protein